MFIETILTVETTTVELDQPVVVSRAKAGLHLILSNLVEQALDSLLKRDTRQAAAAILSYIEQATGRTAIERVDPKRLLRAFLKLERFNRLRVDHLISLTQPTDGTKVAALPYDFPGRHYATWVHRLATRYGWTRHYIFDELMPEEILVYLQEMAVSELDELDLMRQAHEVFYEYDKKTHIGRYKPVERPAWMIPGGLSEPKSYKVAGDMLPAGVVLDWTSFEGFIGSEVDL